MSNYTDDWEKNLRTVNCMLLLVRGNHDDPGYFQKKLIDFPLMKAVPDYSVAQFASKNIICVGGGVSVDRSERLAAMLDATLKGRKGVKYYWGDEMPVFDRPALTELTANNILIDSVVTHTSPSFCQPIDKSGIGSWLSRDKKLEEDLYRERAVMDELYNYLLQNGHPLTDWFYGHFHTSHTEYISAICFRMLDIMELRELKTK